MEKPREICKKESQLKLREIIIGLYPHAQQAHT